MTNNLNSGLESAQKELQDVDKQLVEKNKILSKLSGEINQTKSEVNDLQIKKNFLDEIIKNFEKYNALPKEVVKKEEIKKGGLNK